MYFPNYFNGGITEVDVARKSFWEIKMIVSNHQRLEPKTFGSATPLPPLYLFSRPRTSQNAVYEGN